MFYCFIYYFFYIYVYLAFYSSVYLRKQIPIGSGCEDVDMGVFLSDAKPGSAVDDDEALARVLQESFDAEAQAASPAHHRGRRTEEATPAHHSVEDDEAPPPRVRTRQRVETWGPLVMVVTQY